MPVWLGDSMVKLNDLGSKLAALDYVQSMTDVTGFGLLGHLVEMCQASGVGAVLYADQVPLLDAAALDYYLQEACVPGGTNRNWASYQQHLGPLSERQRLLLSDPQTSGGLLVAVDSNKANEFETYCKNQDYDLNVIGKIKARGAHLIEVL